jgi:hypothetical protein
MSFMVELNDDTSSMDMGLVVPSLDWAAAARGSV